MNQITKYLGGLSTTESDIDLATRLYLLAKLGAKEGHSFIWGVGWKNYDPNPVIREIVKNSEEVDDVSRRMNNPDEYLKPIIQRYSHGNKKQDMILLVGLRGFVSTNAEIARKELTELINIEIPELLDFSIDDQRIAFAIGSRGSKTLENALNEYYESQ